MSPDSLFLVDEESVQIVQSGMLNPPAAGAVRCERKSRKIIPFCPCGEKSPSTLSETWLTPILKKFGPALRGRCDKRLSDS